MPEIQAFRGIRYDLGHVGSLGDVVAPPYDVIGPDLQESLYKKHPCNVVRLILNRKEPQDDEANNSYTRAAKFLKSWQAEGVLFSEADPAIYVYHQQFRVGEETYTRQGFMARMRLSRFGEGVVFPHEETLPGPKMDRLMLTTVSKTNLSQIFGLYLDADGAAQQVLDTVLGGFSGTPLEATDHLGVVHRLWPVTNVDAIAALSGVMGPKPLFIADGHHRYETACTYRDQLAESGLLDANHPANFVLTMFVAMEDPGLLVLPTHRLFRGLPEMTAEELTNVLGDCFTARPAAETARAAHSVWEDVETLGRQDTVALYTQKDGRWTIFQLTAAGRDKLAVAAAEHTDQWCSLGVSILHRLIINTLLSKPDLPKPRYVHLVDEVVEGLATGEFPLAALVMPATVDHIRTLSLQGERMPPKSTYFYPKLLSGLVLNPLE